MRHYKVKKKNLKCLEFGVPKVRVNKIEEKFDVN